MGIIIIIQLSPRKSPPYFALSPWLHLLSRLLIMFAYGIKKGSAPSTHNFSFFLSLSRLGLMVAWRRRDDNEANWLRCDSLASKSSPLLVFFLKRENVTHLTHTSQRLTCATISLSLSRGVKLVSCLVSIRHGGTHCVIMSPSPGPSKGRPKILGLVSQQRRRKRPPSPPICPLWGPFHHHPHIT